MKTVIKTLGTVAEYINGRAFKPSEWESEGLPIIRIQNLNDDDAKYNYSTVQHEDKYLIHNGDLLFAWAASLGAYIWKGSEAWLNQHIYKVIPYDDVLKDYLYYYLQYVVADLYSKAHGTGMVHITKALFMATKIPVPPLNEQARIISRVEELFSEIDSGIDTLLKTKEQLYAYRQAVLKEAFIGKFTDKEHCKIYDELVWSSDEECASLPEIPHEWRYVPLAQLGDLGRGKSKHRPRNDAKLFEGGKYPFLQTSEVKNASKFITEYSKMYGDFGLAQSKLWPKGTLCITIAANIAETAFLGIDACFPDSVVGFTPNEFVNAWYIKYFIESQKLKLWAFAPATAQKNINLDTLEKLVVPFCSFEEQNRVVEEIESRMTICDSIEQTVETALEQAEAMRQSILKSAFEGRL